MHAPKLLAALFTLATAVTLVPEEALAQSLLIDNFTTGAYQVDVYPSAPDTNAQVGTMLGGVRHTEVSASSSRPYQPRPASLEIPPGGPLILETGFQSFHRLTVSYGWDVLGHAAPLNLDVRGYDRLRIWFDGSDLVENFNIVLYAADGAHYDLLGLNMDGVAYPFCVDFPFDNFSSGGVSQEHRADIDFIALVLQSGSQMGANDFALNSISLVGPSDAGSAYCTIAHW